MSRASAYPELTLVGSGKEHVMQRRSSLTTVSLCVGFVLPLLVVLGSLTARSAVGQIP